MGTRDAKEEGPAGLGPDEVWGKRADEEATGGNPKVINVNDRRPWGKKMSLVLCSAILEMVHAVICLMIGFT